MSKNPYTSNINLLGSNFLIDPSKVTIIEETSLGFGSNRLKFRAILQEKDVVNNNKRKYSDIILMEIVRQLGPKATERKLISEIDHPFATSDNDYEKLKRTSTISLDRACILFTKLEFDGKYIIAECETLTTPKGMIIYSLIKDKVVFGFSLRALGRTKQNPDGTIEVLQDGFKPITFDVVSNPSHSNALITEFITESEIANTINTLRTIKSEMNEIALEEGYMYSLTNNKTPEILNECYFVGDAPRHIDKSLGKEALDVIMESEDFNPGGISNSPEKYCIGNTCVLGTIEESISYFMSMKDNNKIIGFKF